ncbi:MAG: hypothetical protein LBS61_02820 [Endomicrobium sp.]|nr:hypothetical protein [Endomicrobium sp.]
MKLKRTTSARQVSVRLFVLYWFYIKLALGFGTGPRYLLLGLLALVVVVLLPATEALSLLGLLALVVAVLLPATEALSLLGLLVLVVVVLLPPTEALGLLL